MNGNIMISDLLIITESKKGFMAARDTNTFAWRLRTTRDRAGITQFEMCDRIKKIIQQKEPTFDLSYPAYNKYETGDTALPSTHSLYTRFLRRIGDCIFGATQP